MQSGTKHIGAPRGANKFSEICLAPGDPLRAKHIADNFLNNVELVTSVRNCFGYTGYYKGVRVSVIGTGMGIASSQIYCHELITHYGVKTLIRTGTCGTMCAPEKAKIGDIILAMGAGTDSNLNRMRFGGMDYPATCSYELLKIADRLSTDPKGIVAKEMKRSGNRVTVGNIFSADCFYNPQEAICFPLLRKYNIVGIEMEAACLYSLAHENNCDAIAICTVSDEVHLNKYDPVSETFADPAKKFTFKDMPSFDRQTKMDKMISLCLETVVEWSKCKDKWASGAKHSSCALGAK